MTVILLSCQDLFMKNIDLTGQLLFTDSTIPAFFPQRLHPLIQLFQYFFPDVHIHPWYDYEHPGLLLTDFSAILDFFFQLADQISGVFIFQEEHIYIQLFQIFSFLPDIIFAVSD